MININKEKRRFYLLFIIYIFIAFICIAIITSPFIMIDKMISPDRNKFNYGSALTNSKKFLNENIDDLNEIALEYIKNHDLESKKYKKVKSIYYSNYDVEKVSFEIDSKGSALGGQYYGLIHIPSGEYKGEDKLYIDESKGNVFIRKKLKENWFFYYDDYNGWVDLKEVKDTY